MAALADKQSLKQLNEKRLNLESEAEGVRSELASTGAGVDKPLVDKEGYPIPDVDIYRVRHLRQRLAVINTDHKDTMRTIEESVLRGNTNNAEEEEDMKRKGEQMNDVRAQRAAL